MSKITLGDFLNNLARKAGIPTDNPLLVDFLSKTDLTKNEVGKDLYDAIDRALMTKDAAVAHPEVRKQLKSETLNGMDAVLDRLAPGLGLEDSFLNEFKGNKNTFERAEKLVTKLGELAKKAASGKDVNKEIEALNEQLRTLKDTHKSELETKDKTYAEKLVNFRVMNLLSGKKLALPEAMDAELRGQTALTAVNKSLATKGLKIAEENDQLVLRRADGTKYFDEGNREVTLTDFIDGALAQNQLLVVSNPDQNNPDPTKNPVVNPQNPGPKANMDVVSQLDEAFKDSGGLPGTK